MEHIFQIKSLQSLQNIAGLIAQNLKPGDVLCLKGDLGVGKTTLTKCLINHLSDTYIEVNSPTFNLLHLYDSKVGKIWHFDLYRLKNMEEVYELGIEEALNDIAIIEWPELIESILPKSKIDILLEFDEHETQRKVIIKSEIQFDNIKHEEKTK
jgi:tRNA threonylcarbamoyladenosine biosynthesis protein TsaE